MVRFDVLRVCAQCITHSKFNEDCADFVHTHDSIGLGEDGPTHQPVEQLASLRVIPNMDVWRPCGYELKLYGGMG